MTAARPWNPAEWPRRGSCGACGLPAREAPSGRWWHDGRPCRARSQSIWRLDDVDIKLAVVFVPAGQPLPEAPSRQRWHMHPAETDDSGIPTAYDICNTDHTGTVREFLAREAEEGQRA